MKRIQLLTCAFALTVGNIHAAVSPEKAAATVILDDNGLKNLKIETAEVEEANFDETIFALGRIEPVPSKRAVVSSRIPGRVVDLKASLGEMIQAGAEVAKLESRQAGDPPPTITLKAPLGGLVTESKTRLGEPIEPNTPLLEITDLSEVYAIARVPEHLAGKLKPGAIAHIRVSALPDEKFDGKLLRFGTAADRSNGTLDAIFAMPNPSLTLRPEMRAEFSIVLSTRESVASVPRSALQGDSASRFVYVADYELKGAFVKTPVIIGSTNDRYVEIKEGLFPGDKVVTRGGYSLAFAGKGSVSLKAALDAAHGHEHNEDGSEVSKDKKGAKGGGDEHGHEEGGGGFQGLTLFFAITTGVLFVLLLLTMLRKPKAQDDSVATPTTKSREHHPVEVK